MNGIICISPDYKDRRRYRPNTARDLWLERLVLFHGRPVEEFLKSARREPPIRKRDFPSEAMGWIEFFERQGLLKVVPAEEARNLPSVLPYRKGPLTGRDVVLWAAAWLGILAIVLIIIAAVVRSY